jgi:uncharacterized protein (TIGR00255 family)
MIKSMTGFGKSQLNLNSRIITVDIRALNSKQLDLNLRIPLFLRDKEGEIRNMLNEGLKRGKIDVQINQKNNGTQSLSEVNTLLVKEQFNRLKELTQELNISNDVLFSEVMKMPESMMDAEQSLEEKDWEFIKEAINNAISETQTFRLDEGNGLSDELLSRLSSIEQNLNAVFNYETARIELIKSRLKTKIDELLQQNVGSENRFEEEMIYFLEKLDISEEKQRLAAHCSYFRETMNSQESNGRKLGFISQEMGREINTIGSKANHAEMQKLVVLMKDDLEKIKEQISNIL